MLFNRRTDTFNGHCVLLTNTDICWVHIEIDRQCIAHRSLLSIAVLIFRLINYLITYMGPIVILGLYVT